MKRSGNLDSVCRRHMDPLSVYAHTARYVRRRASQYGNSCGMDMVRMYLSDASFLDDFMRSGKSLDEIVQTDLSAEHSNASGCEGQREGRVSPLIFLKFGGIRKSSKHTRRIPSVLPKSHPNLGIRNLAGSSSQSPTVRGQTEGKATDFRFGGLQFRGATPGRSCMTSAASPRREGCLPRDVLL